MGFFPACDLKHRWDPPGESRLFELRQASLGNAAAADVGPGQYKCADGGRVTGTYHQGDPGSAMPVASLVELGDGGGAAGGDGGERGGGLGHGVALPHAGRERCEADRRRGGSLGARFGLAATVLLVRARMPAARRGGGGRGEVSQLRIGYMFGYTPPDSRSLRPPVERLTP